MTPDNGKPPWVYPGGPDVSPAETPAEAPAQPSQRHIKIKDINDVHRLLGADHVKKMFELVDRRMQVNAANARLLVEELGQLEDPDVSIHNSDFAEKFRALHKLNPSAAAPVWALLRRKGMFDAEITAVLNGEKHINAPVAASSPPVFPDVDKKDNPKPTFANARVAIAALGVTCRYNAFRNLLLVGGRPIEQWAGELSDQTVIVLRGLINDTFGFDPGQQHTLHACIKLCLENVFDPIREYLDQLKWDGIPRLASWIVEFLSAEDTPFTREVGRLTLIAGVRRVRQPGVKFDQIVVLEGDQGQGKSSALQVLAGDLDYFSDSTILGLDERQTQEAAAGVWIYELAEIAGISKADTEMVKAFASRTEDRARPAYGRVRVNQKRRCIFVGTTNADSYLKSQTGNRRFWPVKITGPIDLERLKAVRDQLWAEAATVEAAGCSLVLPKELWPQAAIEQEQRLDVDPWIDLLAGPLPGTTIDVAAGEERIAAKALLDILGVPRERQTDTIFKRVAVCMRKHGWFGPAMMRIEGPPIRGYRRPIAHPGRVAPPGGSVAPSGGGVAPPEAGVAPGAAEGGITAPGEDINDWPGQFE
jgi:hypothetical protein